MRLLLLLCLITWHAANGLPSGVNNAAKPVEHFTDRSFKAVAEGESGNFVYSPISLINVLSMASWGAGGETRKQLFEAVANPHESVTPRYLDYPVDDSDDNTGVQLTQVNKIFIAEGFTPKIDFTFMMTAFFHSETTSVNFGKSDEASKTINDWCAAQTNNRIKELVQPDDLSSDTALVLASATYFKGEWLHKFSEDDTTMLPFHVDGETVKNVSTMWIADSFRYGELREAKAKFIELPYKTNSSNDPISMFIIVPDEIDGIQELIKNFNKVTVAKLHEGVEYDVQVLLPKFKIETTLDLEPSLVKLGLTDVFGDSADFTEISEDRPLRVSKIVQKNYIDVNEEGTEAASATSLQVDLKMSSDAEIYFTVDRPFISYIVTEFGVPIVTAVTVDPSLAH